MLRFECVWTLLLCLHSSSILVAGVCDDGWVQGGLFCYYFSSNFTTQAAAQLACEEGYADLLYIDDDGENVFTYNLGPAQTAESYWIGYKQVFGDIWRWESTGKAGAYLKWDIGEPDDEGGCARLTPFIQGVWRDWDCSKKLPFVCKKYADCGVPGDMTLGTYEITPDPGVITSDTVVPQGAVATYTCLEGREYPDESTVQSSVCSIGGVWVPDLPVEFACQPKQCLPPPAFSDKILTNGTDLTIEFGTIVYYKCVDGYWFDQFSKGETRYITCTPDKTWQGDTLNDCTKQYCVRPITANAYADTPLNSFGTVATYECVPGFKYGDNTTVKTFECKEGGWVPDPAPCLEMTCPEYSVPNTEKSTESRAVFTEVVLSCVKGMRFPDTTTRKNIYCQLDETWDKKIAAGCERKRCLGTPPNRSETFEHDWNNTNGEVYRFGDRVNYTCVDPTWYFSDGLQVREVVCNEDGEWSPKFVSDCVGEIIEIVTAFTHKPEESEGSVTFGTVTLIILGTLVGAIVLFDVLTIGKHLTKMKENLFGPSQPKEETGETGEVGEAVQKLDDVAVNDAESQA